MKNKTIVKSTIMLLKFSIFNIHWLNILVSKEIFVFKDSVSTYTFLRHLKSLVVNKNLITNKVTACTVMKICLCTIKNLFKTTQ